ncbi:MAG: xylose isomerase [Candidatus Rokuibacteriota bacterium]|nr:MAG: xylose isomerase [Candidatus Rokubacteria bacterium]PYQ20518.1 MAG: xylose isomerase [Acidobacteriota bacterium]
MRVGNAPVSWGVYEADRPNPPFGRILDEIARAGYEGTELGPYGYLPAEPAALDRELKARRLGLGSSFVALPLDDASRRAASVDHALRVARLLATQGVGELILADDEDPARVRIAGRVPSDGRAGWTDAQWREAAATVEAVAKALRDELGMRVVVHHHAGTFVETPAEMDRLLGSTDPDLVGLLLDTGHCVYGKGDPLEVLKRHRGRVRYLHLKDARADELRHVRTSDISMGEAWKRGVFCPLGEGVVDFPRVIETLRSQAYAGWLIVEQDVVPDAQGRLDPEPFASARKSRVYLRDKAGV